jgi:error-prone DNA polymerase
VFAVVCVPNFALQSLLRHEPELRGRAVGLIDTKGTNLAKTFVLECSPAATVCDVSPGLTAPQAQARCRELILKSRALSAEQNATEILLQTAYAFSPNLENTAPGVCTIDLRGLNFTGSNAVDVHQSAPQQSFEFFQKTAVRSAVAEKQMTDWAASIIDALQRLGLESQVGIASTPNLALLAARAAKPVLFIDDVDKFFHTLPFAALEPTPQVTDIVKRWGIRTAGAFLSLGKEAIAERLGAEALELFHRASAQTIRPLNIVVPTDTFEEQMEFEAHIETIEPLLFVLRRFVEQLATRIALTYRVVGELTLTLRLESGAPYARTFKVPAPTANVDTLFRMLHTHLENLRTEAPVLSLRLAANPVRAEGQQFSLFESALRDPNHFHETLARLGALLGDECAGTPITKNTHQPDEFRVEAPAFHAVKKLSEVELTKPSLKRLGLRLRRFRPVLRTRVSLKGKEPEHVEALPHGQVKQARGPFYTSGNWWVEKQGWVREEWDVKLFSGELYRLCRSHGQWTVEGIYDGHDADGEELQFGAPELFIKPKPAKYVELHCRSAFSFLRGGSRPEELAAFAAHRDLSSVAVCDRDGVYGSPCFSGAAKEKGIRPIVGAEITLEDESVLPVLVQSRKGYQNLCQLLTRAHLRAEKGRSRVRWDELPEFAEGLVALTGDEEGPLVKAINGSWANTSLPDQVLKNLIHAFGCKNVFVEIQRHHLRGEQRLNDLLIQSAEEAKLPLLATNGVLYAHAERRQVMDVFTCLRHHTHLDAAGRLLAPNSERYLKSPEEMGQLFHDLPEAIDNTTRLAERLEFSLENLGYEFPSYRTPNGESMEAFLKRVTYEGARLRYPKGIPKNVQAKLKQELKLINKLGFTGYFLIVWDIVKYCRENNIMAQGRGSAANSAVCYCLHITAVDAVKYELLFERFLSEGRTSWPDIDIDLPSGERREQVIQEVYRRYGQCGAAMTANVITYRGRSAAREVGKVLNIGPDVLDRFSAFFANGDFPHTMDLLSQMKASGLPTEHPRALAFGTLYHQIKKLPRHLGQHSGGMIISHSRLDTVMPLENAMMPGRVVAQWDKDDCDQLGIIKVDLLGLGMMSVLQDSLKLIEENGGPSDIAQFPQEDPETLEMIRGADTIGVFQIESRAQMATLPRMKPKCFYDLVIEVAIIRPGPIQGNLTHPYLKRRISKEEPTYYHPDLKPLLEPLLKRTLGIPLFQEQMLGMAMKLADFSGAAAEELRRALSFHRSGDLMEKVVEKLRVALAAKNHSEQVIGEVISAIQSFALYGFPESHAISFAMLAYASAYMKKHYAPEFYTSLLNNQPMGFYSSATLIKDAQRSGVKFRAVCAMRSEWNCVLEKDRAIRLGLCVVHGLSKASGSTLLLERQTSVFTSMEDFKRRVTLSKEEARTLAEIGALNCFAEHRRDAMWKVERAQWTEDLFAGLEDAGPAPLQPMQPMERLHADFAGTHLTVGRHPMALIRARLQGIHRASDLQKEQDGKLVRIAGNVICRQRPGTAKGFVFISLEDETGISNAVVHPKLFERLRLLITEEPFLLISGRLQNVENVIHVRAQRIERLQQGELVGSASYDFH